MQTKAGAGTRQVAVFCFLSRLNWVGSMVDKQGEWSVCTCRQFPGEAVCVSAVLKDGSRLPQFKAPFKFTAPWDFPGGSVAKTTCSQCRGPGLDLWSGNQIPHAATNCSHAATEKIPHAATKILHAAMKILCVATETWCSQIDTFKFMEPCPGRKRFLVLGS